MSLAARLLGMDATVEEEREEGDIADVAGGGAGARHLLQSSASGGWSSSSSKLTDWKGYQVMSGGAEMQFKPPPSYIGRRFVGQTNKLVGGLLLHQIRNTRVECDGKHRTLGGVRRPYTIQSCTRYSVSE